MKAREWQDAKKRLIREYEEAGIVYCEGGRFNEKCMGNFALSFHHLDKRSSGKAQNTFEQTRLLCAECHYRADQAPGFTKFNEKLRTIR